MKQLDLKRRTKQFSLDVLELCRFLPNEMPFWVIGKQLARCGTSVGANYRSACRAKSPADFIAKLSIVEEEADESQFWLELLLELLLEQETEIHALHQEAGEIVAIMIASKKTTRSNWGG